MGIVDADHERHIKCIWCQERNVPVQTKPFEAKGEQYDVQYDREVACEQHMRYQTLIDGAPPNWIFAHATFASPRCHGWASIQHYLETGDVLSISLSFVIQYDVRADGTIIAPAEPTPIPLQPMARRQEDRLPQLAAEQPIEGELQRHIAEASADFAFGFLAYARSLEKLDVDQGRAQAQSKGPSTGPRSS